jgi:hypothetical protein
MLRIRKATVAALAVTFLLPSTSLAGLGSDKTMYLGGTVTGVKEKTEGKSSTADEKVFTFKAKKAAFEIPFDQVNSLEYGQKAGGIGVAVVVNPLFLFSKKRKHFLTIGWTDAEGKQQAAVFELGREIIRVRMATLEARSSRKIEYQDEEARKSGVVSGREVRGPSQQPRWRRSRVDRPQHFVSFEVSLQCTSALLPGTAMRRTTAWKLG